MTTQTRWVKITSGFASIPYGVVLPVDSERESWPGPNTVAVTYAGKPHLLSGYHVIAWPAPDTQTEPWCNHDAPALSDVTVLRCECGATIDPDSGDVIGEGETGPDAVALGLTKTIPSDPA